MKFLKNLFIKLFIGEKNQQYINKYLGVLIVINYFSALSADLVKGNLITIDWSIKLLLIQLTVVFVFFRVWVFIYKSSEYFFSKIYDKF